MSHTNAYTSACARACTPNLQITNTRMARHTDSSHMFVIQSTIAGNSGTLGEDGMEGQQEEGMKKGIEVDHQ